MNIKELYKIFQSNPVIVTDSRKSVPNSIFFALKGDNYDGNAFASHALKNGAKYAIIDNSNYSDDDKTLLVENSLHALQELANYHRKKNNFKIIAITGSNGKTTTKELIYNIIKNKYNCVATKGNLNNHIGVPLTLLSIPSDAEIGIIEMGANHTGEIELLSSIAEPDCGLITNVGKSHLEGFGSEENILKAKGELYNHLINNNGIIFINSNNKALCNLIPETFINTVNYGNTSDMVSGKVISNSSYLIIQLKIADKTYEIKTQLIGDYNLENIVAAVSVGNYFKLSTNEIIKSIESYIPSNNRSQFIETDNNKIILDAYNANPTSMTEAIRNFASYDAKKKSVILGEMLELGKYAKKEHQNIIDYLKKFNFNNVFLCGKGFQNTSSVENCFDSVKELKQYLTINKINDNTILIKGSRANHLEDITEVL